MTARIPTPEERRELAAGVEWLAEHAEHAEHDDCDECIDYDERVDGHWDRVSDDLPGLLAAADERDQLAERLEVAVRALEMSAGAFRTIIRVGNPGAVARAETELASVYGTLTELGPKSETCDEDGARPQSLP